jgi:hypothetical protein
MPSKSGVMTARVSSNADSFTLVFDFSLMKVSLLTLLLVLGVLTSASAQKRDRYAELPGSGEVPAARVAAMTRQMCDRLQLNEAQYIRLKAANRIKLARLEEIQWQYKADPSRVRMLTSELEAQYDAECSRILTPSQLSLLHNEQHDSVPTPAQSGEGGLG